MASLYQLKRKSGSIDKASADPAGKEVRFRLNLFTMSESNIARGWHIDPFGRHLRRFFDGTAWTDQVQTQSGEVRSDPLVPGSVPPPPVAPPALAPAGGEKKTDKKKVIAGVVAVVAALGVIGALVGDDPEDSPNTSAAGDNESDAQVAESVESEAVTARHPSAVSVVGSFQPPAGDLGSVNVVSFGPVTKTDDMFEDIRTVNVVVRNNTSGAVQGVDVTAIVRDPNGGLLEGSEEMSVSPFVLEPGAWGVGTMEIKNLGDAQVGTLTFNVNYSDGDGCSFFCPTYADISEITQSADSIRGLLTAPERMDTIFGIGVYVYCFNDAGDYLGYRVDFTADETLEAGEQTVFVVDVPKALCPNFALEAYDI